MDKVINWNGLPCLQDMTTGKSVIFTNINSELVICEAENAEITEESFYREFDKMGGFECFRNKYKLANDFTIVLALTERCNAACKYCFLDAVHQGADMSYELIEKSIDFAIKLSDGRNLNIAAFGGEPSVKPDLVKHMVMYSKKKFVDLGISDKKLKFSITTNGYFNDSFCDFLIDNNFKISLSMDGIPLVQQEQRLCNVSISQLERNLSKLANAKNCVLKVRATVTEYSVPYMLDSVKYWQTLGIKRIHFEPVTPGGRASNNNPFTNQPSAITFAHNLIECIKYGEKNGIDIICFPYMNINNAPKAFCDGSIRNRLVVGARGILSTCVEVQDKSHPLYEYLGIGSYDNVNKSFSIDLNMRRICRDCVEYDKNEECSTCPFNYFCAGGCPTRNYRGTMNSDNISEFRCQIMKHIMPFVLRQFYNKTFLEDTTP